MNRDDTMALAAVQAECSHWRSECELMEERILNYDKAFGFLCAHMDRESLCKAISVISNEYNVELPPAIREFMARNLAEQTTEDKSVQGTTLENVMSSHPAVASAKSLTAWAARALNKLSKPVRPNTETIVSPGSRPPYTSPRGRSDSTNASLLLAEAQFKIRDMEQQLKSSQAIRKDLLNKALEARQKVSSLRPAPEVVPVHSLVKTDRDIQSKRQLEANRQWEDRCKSLESQCAQLQDSLTVCRSKLEQSIQESKMPDPQQQWFKAELRTAKKTIDQLRALLQAKQEKIDLMSKLKEVPHRGLVGF